MLNSAILINKLLLLLLSRAEKQFPSRQSLCLYNIRNRRARPTKCSRVSRLCIGQYPVYYKIHLNLRTKLNWPSSPFHVETVLFYSQEYIPQHVKKMAR